MNFYIYWFFTIYHIYKRFSWDKDFVLFASGLFSMIISFGLIGIISLSALIMSLPKHFYVNKYFFILTGVSILVSNWILFVPKDRQSKYYEQYEKERSKLKDTIVFIASIICATLFFIAMMQVRSTYVG